jgi:hypothetical protein
MGVLRDEGRGGMQGGRMVVGMKGEVENLVHGVERREFWRRVRERRSRFGGCGSFCRND